jgi:predicted metal-dependent peptidase|tara:strand:+ start:591 stop:1814 length:1224 start_codon:yes stop_codon:yes gene_type:complete
MEFNLNEHTHRLMVREPFFAALSRRIDKMADKGIPTAGVRVNPQTGYFELRYNPDFFEPLSDEHRTGVIVHEFYHLVFEHVTGRLPDELAGVMKSNNPTQKQAQLFKIWNIAADLSINYLIGRDRLPDMCCFPGEGIFEEYPPGETAEWYYSELKKKIEEQEANGEGDGSEGFNPDDAGQFDDHGAWGEEGDVAQAQARERLKDAVKKAAGEAAASGSGWGSVSQEMRKDIMSRITPKVDWRKVMRYFVKTSQRSERRSTPRRLNKRFPYIHAGKRVTRNANIAISIDQSGSVDDNMLAAFYSELNKLSSIATFTVIPFDDRVFEEKVYIWKKGETKTWERVLCGGTCFNAPTDYVNKGRYDGHIVLTDLCAPKPKASNCQRMWMTTKHYADRPYFKTNERVLAIDT